MLDELLQNITSIILGFKARWWLEHVMWEKKQ